MFGSNRLLVLTYHRVLEQRDPLLPDEIDRAAFAKHLSVLTKCFRVVTLAAGLKALRAGELKSRHVAITFDDGYADNYLHALPLLQQYGAPATFFIATGYLNGGMMWNDQVIEALRNSRSATIELPVGGALPVATLEEKRIAIKKIIATIKYESPTKRQELAAAVVAQSGTSLPRDLMLSDEQLKGLAAAGNDIGAHTVTHPILAVLPDAQAEQEVTDSRERLQQLLGRSIKGFAYPNGRFNTDFDSRHSNLVKRLGFDYAVATDPGVVQSGCDSFKLPRFSPWRQSRSRFLLRLTREYVGA